MQQLTSLTSKKHFASQKQPCLKTINLSAEIAAEPISKDRSSRGDGGGLFKKPRKCAVIGMSPRMDRIPS